MFKNNRTVERDGNGRRIVGPNHGSIYLELALTRSRQEGVTTQQLARLFKVDPATFCHLAVGRRKPTRTLALQLEQLFGISVRAWDLEVEQGALRKRLPTAA